jgi:hypothetical protein
MSEWNLGSISTLRIPFISSMNKKETFKETSQNLTEVQKNAICLTYGTYSLTIEQMLIILNE